MKTIPASRLVLPFVTAFSLFSLGTTAQAQQPAPAPPPPQPAPPAATPAAPPAGAPAAPVPPPSAEVPQPPAEVPPPPADVPLPPTATVEERMADAEAKIEGLNESLTVTNATLSPIAKLKFSGYIQGQWEKHQESVSGLSSTNAPANLDRFSVRRGRLKATYVGENAEYMLQIDATGDAVVLKDAEATFVDTWTPFNFRLTAGQFKVPFGYEVLQSSADREMPERATVIRVLFPGERDRGVRLVGTYRQFKLMTAVVNGNFTQGDPLYGTRDNNRHADLYLRLSGDFDFLVVGVSGQWGQKVASSLSPSTLTITDANMDGIIQASEISRPTATQPAVQPVARRRGRAVLRRHPGGRRVGAQRRGHPVERREPGVPRRDGQPVPDQERPRLYLHRHPEHRRPPWRRGSLRLLESDHERPRSGVHG